VKSVVPLDEAHEASLYGAKAIGLGDATRGGLPIPPGVALSGEMVDAIVEGDTDALDEVMRLVRDLPTPLAVRSSAADEDGADASFAGQHLTLLNVRTAADVDAALREIWWSANSDSAISYRKRVGLFTRPSIGVVIQSLLAPDSAGVMFTQNPINGADERVIEASWGLGEVVVSGRVIPDHFRIDRAGAVVERVAGVKKVMLRTLPDGGTEEQDVGVEQVEQPCLDDVQLAKLHDLAVKCEAVYGPARDIEWAFADGELYLLQCRAVTRAGSARPRPPAPDSPPPPEVVVQVPFFAGLDDEEVKAISHMFKERRFPAGDTIAKEGAGGAAFFVIDSGEAVVTVHGREVATLTRGDHFGEVALIDDGARSATVSAKTDVVCFGLTYWEFRPLVQHNATLAWNLLQEFAKRLRSAQEG